MLFDCRHYRECVCVRAGGGGIRGVHQSLQCQPYTPLSPFMPPSPQPKAQGPGNQLPVIPRNAGMEGKAQEKLLIEGQWADDGTSP